MFLLSTKYKKYKIIILSLFITFFSGLSFASSDATSVNESVEAQNKYFKALGTGDVDKLVDSSGNIIESPNSISKILYQDLDSGGAAYNYIAQLFGGWTSFNSADYDSVTLLTYVAGLTNIIALILGVAILSYITYAGVLNTAATGEFLGKSGWSKVWLPFRTALAFGLIVPMGASSLGQARW